MARDPINAAGGIVMRGGARPRIAVVRRSKDDRWVLPRGKLKRDENPIAGAKREAVEETGHRVQVHEFLGAITYSARGRPKLVQFWRMLAAERPSYDLTEDITEVRWLPLSAAIRRLSFPLEKLFLRSVGRALRRAPSAAQAAAPVGTQVRAQRRAECVVQPRERNRRRSVRARSAIACRIRPRPPCRAAPRPR